MLSLEKITGSRGKPDRYFVVEVGRERELIAAVDGLERAGCLLRFLKGSRLEPREYQIAVETMRKIDEKRGGGSDDGAEERVSGEDHNGVSDGNTSD